MSPTCSCYPHLTPASLDVGSQMVSEALPAIMTSKERIRKLFDNVQLSISSYDTAWVAMVPSPNSPDAPCFPNCLNWLINNQLSDGSWGLPHHHSLLLKDTLSSTLASIVALKRWSIGHDQVNKGLHFIASNCTAVTDENQHSPLGFDIIFPGMLERAKDLDLRLPLQQTDINAMLQKRDLEIKRCRSQKRGAYLAYVSEGLGNFNDAELVMKYQMKNGSLFNSPSATAAALIRHQNQNSACLNYLTSLLDKFGNAVPTAYPLDLYLRLCLVDNLERLGITRHFTVEIKNVLEETYRSWVRGDEQIFMDVVTCAVAFRLLRTHGYDVSSDALAKITKEGPYKNLLGKPFKDTRAALEVYQASQIIYRDELPLGEQITKSNDFLKPQVSSLERISSRRNIECYNVDDTRILKTSYCSSNISNKDFLRLAVEDFNSCQSIYREELETLERWVVEKRLDTLKFVRQRAAYCYFSAASTLSSPELSDARMCWAKSGILTGVLDDFFDVGGSMDELVNLIHSVNKWDVNVATDCCSEEVGIIFVALKDAISWIGEMAFKWQSRSVTSHVVETWLEFMKCMLKEAIWSRDNCVPTLNEYMDAGYVSIALGPIVLPALYLIGPKLSEDIVGSSEYRNLFELMGTHGRLLNDIQTFKREAKEGKMNAVTLQIMKGITEEEAIEGMKALIEKRRREMLQLVLEEKGSAVPRGCKDVFMNMCSVLDLFYGTHDGYTTTAILGIVHNIIYQPLSLEIPHPIIVVD